MNRTIQADLHRYGGLTGFSGFLKGLLIPGFWYTFIIRKLNGKTRFTPLWFLYSFLRLVYGYRYGFQVPASTSIGEGFYIGHFGSLVINRKTVIGKNCNVAHGITIGQANRGKRKGAPTIGDNVWIGTGAVLVGKITIGTNVLIAPNSFVNMDVPDNSIVIGNPAQIRPSENATEGYINHILR